MITLHCFHLINFKSSKINFIRCTLTEYLENKSILENKKFFQKIKIIDKSIKDYNWISGIYNKIFNLDKIFIKFDIEECIQFLLIILNYIELLIIYESNKSQNFN